MVTRVCWAELCDFEEKVKESRRNENGSFFFLNFHEHFISAPLASAS